MTRLVLLVVLLAAGCDAIPGLSPSVPDLCPDERFGQGEGYDARSRECLWDAYSNGRAASFRTSKLTPKGDPVTYKVTVGGGKVEVVFDNTNDTFATERGKQTLACQRLEKSTEPASGRVRFLANGCRGGSITALVF